MASVLVFDAHQVLRGLLPPALDDVGPVRLRFADSLEQWEQVLASRDAVDVLFADWDAFEGGGLSSLHGLRQRPSLNGSSLFFFAARVTPEMQALVPLYRLAGFVTKPFTVVQVAAAIRQELARRARPDRLELLLQRAWRLLDDGAAPKALLVYQWLRSLHPDSLAALYGTGTALGAVGELEAGLAMLEEVVCQSPLFLEAWNRMTDLAEAEGDEERARLFSERVEALAPGSPEALLRKARAAQQAGQLDVAERLLRQALKTAPELWAPVFELTELLLSQDRVYEAARIVDRAHTKGRGRIDLLNHLGVALRRRGHLSTARQLYALALAEQPDNPSLLFNSAVAHHLAGDSPRALEDLREAVRLRPDFAQARRLLELLSAGHVPVPAELEPAEAQPTCRNPLPSAR